MVYNGRPCAFVVYLYEKSKQTQTHLKLYALPFSYVSTYRHCQFFLHYIL